MDNAQENQIADFSEIYGEYAGPHIATGIWECDEHFFIAYRGIKEKLIAAGLATAAMFPEGKTPTGRPRTNKHSKKSAPVSWSVRLEPDHTYTVYYYEALATEAEHELFTLWGETCLAQRIRNAERRLRKQEDDNDDEDDDD